MLDGYYLLQLLRWLIVAITFYLDLPVVWFLTTWSGNRMLFHVFQGDYWRKYSEKPEHSWGWVCMWYKCLSPSFNPHHFGLWPPPGAGYLEIGDFWRGLELLLQRYLILQMRRSGHGDRDILWVFDRVGSKTQAPVCQSRAPPVSHTS